MNDFEAHEGSYDHQHRKRLKDLRTLTRDPTATAKARAAEARAAEESGLKSLSLPSASTNSTIPSSSASGAVKKKPVFKSTLQPHNAAALGSEAKPVGLMVARDDPAGAVRNGWAEERYRPRFVMGCGDGGCGVCDGGRMVDLGDV
ncbi:uncharacterized protein LTR77_005873 [Saxophila tyrrhenica]|uniref:Uncharacterized protein n=1 Tax=Saxophila tyrrhenica TaxID=1690608 RepID=A0AAV9PDT6_9PEZI|nr:hypothetical protein LTR77_005873 [Saxophila tyrrhenica]